MVVSVIWYNGNINQALALLRGAPVWAERDAFELRLRVALGAAQIATLGYSAPEVEENYNVAETLCRSIGSGPQMLQVLLGLQSFHFVRSELHKSLALANECAALTTSQAASPGRLLAVQFALGATVSCMGENLRATQHFDQGLKLYDGVQTRRAVQDNGVACLAFLGWTQLLVGKIDTGRRTCLESLALARRIDHPFSKAFALNWLAAVHIQCEAPDLVVAFSEEALEISAEEGLLHWAALALAHGGAGHLLRDEIATGYEKITTGLARWQATGAANLSTSLLTYQAWAHDRMGEPAEAFACIERSIDFIAHTDERWFEAEVLRSKGKLLEGKMRDRDEAESAYRDAWRVAKQQHATFFELKIALELDRMSIDAGRPSAMLPALRNVLLRIDGGAGLRQVQAAMQRIDQR